MTRLSIETRQRIVRFRDAGYTYKEILQRYLVLALPESQHRRSCAREERLVVSRTCTRETTSPSSRAYKHILARPPALPREQTNTHSRDHQPFLASRPTRSRETTRPSSRAHEHVLARELRVTRETLARAC